MRLTRSDIRGFIVLLIVIGIFSVMRFIGLKIITENNDGNISSMDSTELEIFHKEMIAFHKQSPPVKTKVLFKKENLFMFDPNIADSSTLIQLGFSEKLIKNILRYRSQGGTWKNAEHFRKLYGLTENDYAIIKPYIAIKAKSESQPIPTHHKKEFPINKKFSVGTIIDLNLTDTTQLKMIPGIGSYYAKKIINYREKLGGFVSIHQISEIEGLPKDIQQWFEIKHPTTIKTIHMNTTDFKTLVRHPYLNYEQTKAIINYRQKYGKITHWETLLNLSVFTEKDIEKLTPYFRLE